MPKQIGTLFGMPIIESDAVPAMPFTIQGPMRQKLKVVIPTSPGEPILLVPEPDDTERITVTMEWPE